MQVWFNNEKKCREISDDKTEVCEKTAVCEKTRAVYTFFRSLYIQLVRVFVNKYSQQSLTLN